MFPLWPVAAAAFMTGLSAGGIYAIPAWFPEALEHFDVLASAGKGFTKQDEEMFRTLVFNMACMGMCNPFSGFIVECFGTIGTVLISFVALALSTIALEFLHIYKIGMPYGYGLCILVEDTAIVTMFFAQVFGSLEVFPVIHHKKLNSLIFAGYGLSAFVLCQVLGAWPTKPKVPGFRMFYRGNMIFWSLLSSACILMRKAGMKANSIAPQASVAPGRSLTEVPGGRKPNSKPGGMLVFLTGSPFSVLYVALGNITAILLPKSPWSEMLPDEADDSLNTAVTIACFMNFAGRLVCGAMMDMLPKELYTILTALGLSTIGFMMLTLPGGLILMYAGMVVLYIGFAMYMVSSIVVIQKTNGAAPCVLMLSSGGVQALVLGYVRGAIGLDWQTYCFLSAAVLTCCMPVMVVLGRYLEPSNLEKMKTLIQKQGSDNKAAGLGPARSTLVADQTGPSVGSSMMEMKNMKV